ncbi:hypothetical protein [Qipengyuania sp. MTN3-11]
MTTLRFQSSSTDKWSNPRAYSDPSMRLRKYGPIRPMVEKRRLLDRLLGR